jgi:regulator of PEP synthase PpsR (kinase-PPPase family)
LKSSPIIYALSDSTSNLLRHMLAAFLTQFPPQSIDVRFEPFVKDQRELKTVFARIEQNPGAVIHAVVTPSLKSAIERRSKELGLKCHDATGPTVAFIEKCTRIKPTLDRQSLHRVDEAYHRRIDAMEFTLNHDDALGLPTLHEADVVLAGISRTSKTPTSILLAQQGYRVANVALAMQVDPPTELLAMDPSRVVGLLIQPAQLAEIRTRRQIAWHMPTTDYNERDRVEEEITWSRRLFSKMNWRTLDITDQAVEETAARIVEIIKR